MKRSRAKSIRGSRAARRHFRPRVESLEARLALAIGVYNDDFTADVTPANPGFDQFDTYPARDINPNNPGDLTFDDPNTINTVLPDDMLIANNLPHQSAGLRGETGRNGRYFVQDGNPGDPGWGLHAHGHILGIVSSAFATPQVTFTVPPAGTPGGLAADEEVSGIGVSAQGFGKVVIIGAIGSVTVELDGTSTWHRIAAFRDDSLGGGTRLGAIQQLQIFSFEFVAIDNVTVEISSTVPYTPPEANDDVIIVHGEYGDTEVFNPIDNDFDAQGFTLRLIDFTQPPRGSVQRFDDPFGNFRGFTYHASADAMADPNFREDSFTYTIANTSSAHASATDTATVRLVLNTPPAALFDEYEVPHGTFGTLIINAARGLLDNDFDRDDSDTLTITAHSQPRHGHLTVMPDGSFRYTSTTPDRRILPDGFTYSISDGIYQAHSYAFILVPNEVPIVSDDFVVVEHGLSVIDAFDVTTNDPVDPDGDLVGPPQIDTPPQHGTLTVLPDGRLRYVPTRDHVFSDTFTYRRADPNAAAEGASNLATVRILVPNQLPIAQNDEYRQTPGLTFQISAADGVLSNDSDPDGDALFHATLTKQAGYGAATFYDDGSFTYEPEGDYEGVDIFGYVVEDGIGQSHAATVSIVMTTGLTLARDDIYVIRPNSARRALHLLSNDWDPDGMRLTIAINSEPSHGRLLTCGCRPGEPGFGQTYYQPDPGFEGIDSFEYVAFIDDGPWRTSPPATVFLQVTDDPSVPTTNSDFFSVLHDDWLNEPPYGFLDNDPGVPGQSIFVTLVAPPRHGTLSGLSMNEDGGFNYTPNPGFVGHDSFQYRVAVGGPIQYQSEVEIASITVGNQEPVARDDFFPVPVGGYVWGNVLANDHDPDADDNGRLRVELTSEVPGGAIAVLEPDGDFYFRPLSSSISIHGLRYRIFDGAEYSQVAEINVGSYQDNRAYLTTPNRKTILVESTPGTLLEASVSATPPQPTPADVEFPLGFFSFVIRNVPAGGQADVHLFVLGRSPPAINQYWKYGQDANDPHDLWYEFNRIGDTGAEFIGNDIVLHFVDGQRGDSDFLANGVIVDPGGPAFVELRPEVQNVTINDGHVQRSKVNSINVAFSELVTIMPGAFEVRKIGARNPLKLNIQLTIAAGHTVARLTFKKGAGVVSGSVADGQYRLTIRGDKVRGADGRLLDGDANGADGGNHVDEFFRLFGDSDGDGDVDGSDKLRYLWAHGKRSRDPGYLWYLDSNANGRIWSEDLAHFLLAYSRSNPRR